MNSNRASPPIGTKLAVVATVHTRRPSRLADVPYAGHARYFVTMCCLDRHPHFRTASVAACVRGQLLRTAPDCQFAILAYTFMPDHLHFLAEGLSDVADFRRFVALLRRRSSASLWTLHPKGLWQDGYYERILRRDEASVHVCHYILNNPVRAGLVAEPSDYPFSWSCL